MNFLTFVIALVIMSVILALAYENTFRPTLGNFITFIYCFVLFIMLEADAFLPMFEEIKHFELPDLVNFFKYGSESVGQRILFFVATFVEFLLPTMFTGITSNLLISAVLLPRCTDFTFQRQNILE